MHISTVQMLLNIVNALDGVGQPCAAVQGPGSGMETWRRCCALESTFRPKCLGRWDAAALDSHADRAGPNRSHGWRRFTTQPMNTSYQMLSNGGLQAASPPWDLGALIGRRLKGPGGVSLPFRARKYFSRWASSLAPPMTPLDVLHHGLSNDGLGVVFGAVVREQGSLREGTRRADGRSGVSVG